MLRSRKYMAIVLFLCAAAFPESKELVIPDGIQVVKENINESMLKNLSDIDIYQPIDIQVIDNFIVIGNGKPSEIIKLDLNGNVLIRKGKEGRGPGEFIFPLAPRKVGNGIVFIDINNKIIFCDMDLNFVKEIKLPLVTRDMIVLNDKFFVVPERFGSEFYLCRYSFKGDLIKKFGKKENPYGPKNELSRYNRPRLLAYDKTRDIIWCDNMAKYELRSFTDKGCKDVIQPETEIFKSYKAFDKDLGAKVIEIDARSIRIVCSENNLYHFFHKKKVVYLDIFNLKPMSHARRIMLKNKYKFIAHIGKNEFFGISEDEEGDNLLYRITIN